MENALKKIYRGNYTIIELLVTISIIAILVSIMLPGLNMAKKVSLKMICSNNLKQVGTGVSMYMNDHNGHILPGYYASVSYWTPVIDEYIGGKGREISYKGVSAKVWACPENNRVNYAKLQSGIYSTGQGIYTGYVANSHIRDTNNDMVGLIISKIKRPSSLIHILEVKKADGALGPITAIKYSIYGFGGWSFSKHGGGSDFMYVDGHVAWQADSSPERSFIPTQAMSAWIP